MVLFNNIFVYASPSHLRPSSGFAFPAKEEMIERVEKISEDIVLAEHSKINGKDCSHLLKLIFKYKVFDAQTLVRIITNLKDVLEKGLAVFNNLSHGEQMDVYNLANLLELSEKLKTLGIHAQDFSYDPFEPKRGFSSSDDINAEFSRGYEVTIDTTWSRLTTKEYAVISQLQGFNFPRDNVSFLSLCGGSGYPLSQIAPVFSNSRLVLLDANGKNIKSAMTAFLEPENNNIYEIKLTDARLGFGGIPYENETFDVISMVGRSEFGMSFDDLCRLMSETIRVLNHRQGFFLVESTEINRYLSAIRRVMQNYSSYPEFEISTYELSKGALYMIVAQQKVQSIQQRLPQTASREGV